MARPRLLLAGTLLATLVSGVALAAPAAPPTVPPTPDLGVLQAMPGAPCPATNEYEAHINGKASPYGSACRRIRFIYGPLNVKPGQMDVSVEPVTIQKPSYDGFIVRFKPDLVFIDSGGKPRTDQMHLHHATWLNAGESYGDGPFFAAGEEKTIAWFPTGYGMAVKGSDQWLLLYMVHNARSTTERVYITYDIDYVEKSAGEKLGIAPVKPIWLDVQKHAIAPGAPSTSSNPVFNVQKGFGHRDPETGRRVCTWPKENCARTDVYGNVTPQQGKPVKVAGTDWTVPADLAGTMIGLGGHLHPGSLRDEVSLVRKGKEKMIFISDALYWHPTKIGRTGGPPNSWNMSMGVSGAPLGWKVKIKAGDVIRINTVSDSQDASWYENMGIVVGFVAPKDPHKPAGVDVFTDRVILDRGISDRALTPPGPWTPQGWRPKSCHPDLTSKVKRLCLRGQITHGPVKESGYYGGCGKAACPTLPTKEIGSEIQQIVAAGFSYGVADFGVIGQAGLPAVKKGEKLTFVNADSFVRVPHTFTRCAAPCTGVTGVDYPVPNGGNGRVDDVMDFDSTQIGYGLPWDQGSGQFGGDKPVFEAVQDGAYWEFTPTRVGTYTFFCRVHPAMRGAFAVIP